MKFKHLLTIVAACALVMPAYSEEDTPLTKEMEKLNKALKAVNRSLTDATQKDANIAKIADAKAACAAALKYEPASTKNVPAADKAKYLSDYKASMEEVGKNLDALKAAIEGGKTEDAKALMEKLNGQKKDGHKKFKADD
jgi:soluble cytochrome b562